MRLRRCAILFVTPKERLEFDLAALAKGGTGVQTVIEWIGLAPHLEQQLVLSPQDLAVLGTVSPMHWIDTEALEGVHGREVLDSLLERGLLLGEGAQAGANTRDEQLRALHWRGLDAVAHKFSRWHDVDTLVAQQVFGNEAEHGFLDRLGPCPPAATDYAPSSSRTHLSRPAGSPLEDLLCRRVTCRNYDVGASIGVHALSTVLYRTFGARAVHDYAPSVQLLKKGVPSAGGLHPVGACVLVRSVEGVEPGLYRYHPIDHALELVAAMGEAPVTALAQRFLGGQTYFAQAHVVVALVGRFHRNYWKYRNHAKAYRAVVLDAGHLSQTLYLAATELGLGAFITAGVNELDIENAFELDPMEEGVIAACGFGSRSPHRVEVELDPLNAVWPSA